ncbi:UxaA family hydrolase [Sphingosinicella sp. CPCC 101087]|uniref:UxaA family hydrolase n=1 Tax=Sphingosinicella sp. CPCC 101087 TaxID=2497754 RepID=UPI00101C15E0|nr:UxaA family hydrolase [Sphingosinicella sp. CPCC 101087]
MTVPSLILLHEEDNVLVCVAGIAAGETIVIDGAALPAPEAVAVGHKVARRALGPGDKVLKYGAPIGSMTRPAELGAWVHMHNMKSDYIATHTRQTLSEDKH